MTDQVNRGFLYPVKERKSEKSPSMTGKIFISPELAGKEVEIAGWTQLSKAGHKYISLAVSPPYQQQQQQQPPPQQQQNTGYQAQQNFNTPPPADDDFTDDIPF